MQTFRNSVAAAWAAPIWLIMEAAFSFEMGVIPSGVLVVMMFFRSRGLGVHTPFVV